MSKKTFLLILPAFFLLFGCGLALSGPELQEVTLAMTYIPNVQFAPWYVAEVKGFFQEEGIKVDFDYRMDIDALQLVGAGHLDFAVAGGDQVITARSQGIPVTYLLSLFTKFPPSVVALEEAGIKKPQDLQGKKIGLPLYGTSLLATKAILRAGGVKESAVELVDIGYTQIASLTQGRVDAVVVFTNNEPRSSGRRVQDYGDSVVGVFFFGGTRVNYRRKQISLAPQKVGAMIRATRKECSIRWSSGGGFEITLSYLPELGKKQAALEKQVFWPPWNSGRINILSGGA